MLSVPRALTSKSVLGSTSDVVTATWPARWRMASCPRTCSARAVAFLTSSFMNLVRLGYRVRTYLRLRSVPGRLRLSSRVTNHPSLMKWRAALTPRNPAPPLIRACRSGFSGRPSGLAVLYRTLGSIAPPTLARGSAPEELYGHDPGCAREDKRFAPFVGAPRVEIGARHEQRGEDAVHHVQDSLARAVARGKRRRPEQALQRGDGGHDQVGRAKSPAHRLGAEVLEGAPEAEQNREDDQDPRAVGVQKDECVFHSGSEPADLLAEIVDGQPQPLLELDAWPPAELLGGALVVERDPIDVAFARRAEPGLELVLGEQRELAEQVVDRDRDPGADVIGPSIATLEGRDVGHGDVADVEHVA